MESEEQPSSLGPKELLVAVLPAGLGLAGHSRCKQCHTCSCSWGCHHEPGEILKHGHCVTGDQSHASSQGMGTLLNPDGNPGKELPLFLFYKKMATAREGHGTLSSLGVAEAVTKSPLGQHPGWPKFPPWARGLQFVQGLSDTSCLFLDLSLE